MDNEAAFDYIYQKLADDLSRKNMVAYLNSKISGDESYISKIFETPSTYFKNI